MTQPALWEWYGTGREGRVRRWKSWRTAQLGHTVCLCVRVYVCMHECSVDVCRVCMCAWACDQCCYCLLSVSVFSGNRTEQGGERGWGGGFFLLYPPSSLTFTYFFPVLALCSFEVNETPPFPPPPQGTLFPKAVLGCT
eukprot:Sspe_Gene.17697::Locus_6296_Transcript_1_5_Confidence_0.167_Length_519::g.17697::m.17697